MQTDPRAWTRWLSPYTWPALSTRQGRAFQMTAAAALAPAAVILALWIGTPAR